MSSTETLQQDRKRFTIEVLLSDPFTSEELELDFIVDTGSPDAFALPTQYSGTFLRKIGQEKRGGVSGRGSLADVYVVNVEKLGSLDVSHTTSCIFSMADNWDFGLMGFDFLKFLVTRIYDEPDSKLMDIQPEHL